MMIELAEGRARMGVLDGLDVLDVSWGISGPMTAMLLADQGAKVIRIERPGGAPLPGLSGYRVWNRGKRSAEIDLADPLGKERFLALASRTDVMVESFPPGTTKRLGIDYESLSALNPRLIHCSITAYGETGPDASRPGIDGLVAARTGQQYEVRGEVPGTIARLSGSEGGLPGMDAPPGCWVGPDRDGPLFSGVPWTSLATFYIASIAINAAIRARQVTGIGQHVQASLLQGVLVTTVGAWQRAERADTPGYQTWVFDPRAPKAFFQGSDGRWLHHWVPLPEFILTAVANEMKVGEGVTGPRGSSMRVGTVVDDMVILHSYQDALAEAVAKYPSADWVRLGAEVGAPVQMVRSPEEALLDPSLVADGCVVEVDDPEFGPIRQVGRVIDMPRHPAQPPKPAPRLGQHTAEIVAEADTARAGRESTEPARPTGVNLSSPLEGVLVIDLGLAVAGPWGTQVLAQLGARVIKVNTVNDRVWLKNHIAMCCNRDKESIVLNLKDPEGMAILEKLVARADVVQHNMRYDAAQRLGVDYNSLAKINPALVYCHTIGHEQGPRQFHTGNDQTAAALAGTEWLDGGLDHGGRPVWAGLSLGDIGNGFLSALGIIQAIYDRDRTGEGQFLRTSILYAHLLNTSTTWVSADGSVGDRQHPDAEQYGWNALYRLYRGADDGWLCIAVLDDATWSGLLRATDRSDLGTDGRFATAQARLLNDSELVSELTEVFRSRPAAEWFDRLDDMGVPCEISDPGFPIRLFDDPDGEQQNLTASFEHPKVGRMQMAGLYFDLSATPGRIWGPPLWPGQDTAKILNELGYDDEQIAKLVAIGAVQNSKDE